MINSKILYAICALGFGALLIPVTISFNRQYKIYTYGNLVPVTVTSVPRNLGERNKGDLWFKYEGHDYETTVGGKIDEIYHEGDTIQLRYLGGYEDYFMLPYDNPIPWGIADISMFIVGFIICIYYYFNIDKTKK